MLSLGALELDAQCFFHRLAYGVQRGQLRRLGERPGFAGVGGQEPGQVLRRRQRGGAQQHPLEELGETGPWACSVSLGWRRQRPELGFGRRQHEPLQLHRLSIGVEPEEEEVAQVGHQHLAVRLEVAEHLLAGRDSLHVGGGRFHLDGSPGRLLAAEEA